MSSKVMTKGELFEVLKDIPDDWEIYINGLKEQMSGLEGEMKTFQILRGIAKVNFFLM